MTDYTKLKGAADPAIGVMESARSEAYVTPYKSVSDCLIVSQATVADGAIASADCVDTKTQDRYRVTPGPQGWGSSVNADATVTRIPAPKVIVKP